MNILELIQGDGFQFKKVANTGGGEYAGACPWCGGTDRFRVWPESGRYWCRGCDAKGDAIQYLGDFRKLSFKEASSLTGKSTTATARPATPQAWVPETPQAPPEAWQEGASSFLDLFVGNLWSDQGATMRQWLYEQKGLSEKTMRDSRLGFNPKYKSQFGASWGLSDDVIVHLSEGLVIPTIQGETIHRLKIRRTNPGKYSRYMNVTGSGNSIMLWGKDKEAVVVVESELDAILLNQEAGDLCTVIALAGATNKPDSRTDSILKQAKVILIALDTDEAGAKATWDFWLKAYGAKVKRWPTIGGKDPSEARLNGLNLRDWILAAILPEVDTGQEQASSLKGKETPPPIDADDQELIDWLMSAELPQEPFDLDCARRVLDPAKFFDSLRREIAGRQSSPRWRCGATQADLRRLKENSLKKMKEI